MKPQKIFNLFLVIVLCAGVFTAAHNAAAAPSPVAENGAETLPAANIVQPRTGNPAPPAFINSNFGSFELNRADISAYGELPEDALGYFGMSFLGDMNNDGYDDFGVSSFQYSGTSHLTGPGCGGYSPGAFYIVLGRPNIQITSALRNTSIRDLADVILVGDSADYLGRTPTIADLNADGKNDLIVGGGANSSTYWTSGTLAHGAAFVIWGRSANDWNSWMTSSANSINSTTNPSGYSCYNSANHSYKVKSIYTAADASILGTNPEDRLGWTQMGSADVNGDGHLDLLTSAFTANTGTGINPYTNTGNGMVYVVLADGAKTWTMNMPIATTATAILKGDTILGVWNDPNDNPDAGLTIPVGLSENIGGWLTGVGDVTGDGKDDFVVGSWRHMLGLYGKIKGPLNAYLISGASITNGINQLIGNVALTKFSATLSVYPGQKSGTLGWSSAKLGDINNDGISDFSINDPWAPVDAIGNVYVFYGRNSSTPWPAIMNLTDSISQQCGWSTTTLDKADILLQPYQRVVEFGNAVSNLGDVNGDGHDDFAVSASAEPRWGADYPDGSGYWYSRGKTFLFFGGNNLLSACDYVVQSERYALPNVSWFPGTGWRSQYRRLWSEETGVGVTNLGGGSGVDMQRGALIYMGSPIPGDFNGDGKNDILVADINASARETCDTITTTAPEYAQCNLGKIYVLLGKSALHDTAVPELWFRDTSLGNNPDTEDIGNEPNLESDVVNASPDLWVRSANDKLREHQPITSTGQNVFVNARITNSGSEWDVNSTQTNTVEIYWTYSSNFTWPTDFTGTRGGLVGTITTPTIGPGDRKVFSLPWTVPTLANGCTVDNISFLARFTTGVVETSNGWDNVRNNRRIVARAGTATTSCLHSVDYNANNATGGTVPIDSNTYLSGATVTVLGNTGSLVKAGYSFNGWNEKPDGTGISYSAGNTFIMDSANVTLYAQWSNNPPTNIILSASAVLENKPAGTVVGNLSAIDPDAGATFTFALGTASGCASTNNASFQIVGVQLKTKAAFDYETKNSYVVCICVTDNGGLTFYKSFTIKVTNVVDEVAKNGGFELYTGTSKIPTNWFPSLFTTTDGKDVGFKTGKYAVKITNTLAKNKTLTQTLLIPTGAAADKFTFSYYVKGTTLPPAGLCQGQVLLYNGTTLIKTSPLPLPCGKTGTFAYTLKTQTFTAGAVYNKVVIKFTFSMANSSVWFDGVSLKK